MSHVPKSLSSTMALYSRIEDPTTSVQRFCQHIRKTFVSEGLMKLDPFQKTARPLQVRMIDTRRLARNPIMGEQQKSHIRPRIDATNIHGKYKDFMLMKNVQLQEIHISEIGLKEVLYENVVVPGYRNIATIPLPGIAADGTEPLQTELDDSIPVRTPE